MQHPDVLVIGTSVDSHVAAVLDRLPPGLAVCRLDVDRFPVGQHLTLRPGGRPRARLDSDGGSWGLDGVPVAWFRRLGKPGLDPRVPEEHRAFALGEVEQALTGALDLIEPQHWINEYWSARRAAVKLWQFEVIIRLGIPNAELLVTNSGAAVREWTLGSDDRLVYKSLNSPLIESGDGTTPRRFVFTSPVTSEDLRDDRAISLAPCQFQRLLTPKYELRVTTIGRRHIAVRIDHETWDSQESSDWRAHPERLAFCAYELPTAVSRQLNDLMTALRLDYGASDWIVEEDGRHVLLEVNPHGAWLWLERELPGLGISDAIADELVAKIQARETLPSTCPTA